MDYGQHQQVLFVNHYDTISYSASESITYAPGADDAHLGRRGAARGDAHSSRTTRSGTRSSRLRSREKRSGSAAPAPTCGSTRRSTCGAPSTWTRRRSTANEQSPDGRLQLETRRTRRRSVALGDAFVQANARLRQHHRLRRRSSATRPRCARPITARSGTSASPRSPSPRTCTTTTSARASISSRSPTCHDTVTQMWNGQLMFTQDYSWPSEKAAIAVVAAPGRAALRLPGGRRRSAGGRRRRTTRVASRWTAAAGVTNYVVERAATCAGTVHRRSPRWPARATRTSAVVNGTSYAYRVRTCPTQVSACVDGHAAGRARASTYQPAARASSTDSGDHDAIPDNCELVTVQLNLVNDGNVPLTDVRLASSRRRIPPFAVASALPQLRGIPRRRRDRAGQLQVLPRPRRDLRRLRRSVHVHGDRHRRISRPPSVRRSFTLTAERSTVAGPLTYGFETDFSRMDVTTRARSPAAPEARPARPRSRCTSARTSTTTATRCVSPLISPTATSHDVHVGQLHHRIGQFRPRRTCARWIPRPARRPCSRRPGRSTPRPANTNLLCDNLGNLKGWSGAAATWRQASFDLSPFAGHGDPDSTCTTRPTLGARHARASGWISCRSRTRPRSTATRRPTPVPRSRRRCRPEGPRCR